MNLRMQTVNKTVETILVTSDNGECTYSITKRIDGQQKKHMILVMLYPTRTAGNILADDDTMNHIMAHLPELGYDSLTILNLFSKVVKGCRMSTRGIMVDRENLDYIYDQYIRNEEFKGSDWVIAWGNTASTSKVVNESKEELLKTWGKQFPKKKLYQLTANGIETKEGMATHPLFLGIRCKFGKWVLKEINWKEHITRLENVEKNKKSMEKELK